MGHYATNSKAFLVLSLTTVYRSSAAQLLSARSRPFNEHLVAAYIKLCLWCSSENSCCKGKWPAAAVFWSYRVNASLQPQVRTIQLPLYFWGANRIADDTLG